MPKERSATSRTSRTVSAQTLDSGDGPGQDDARCHSGSSSSQSADRPAVDPAPAPSPGRPRRAGDVGGHGSCGQSAEQRPGTTASQGRRTTEDQALREPIGHKAGAGQGSTASGQPTRLAGTAADPETTSEPEVVQPYPDTGGETPKDPRSRIQFPRHLGGCPHDFGNDDDLRCHLRPS